MSDFLLGVAGNIVANIVFWLLGGIVVGVILGQRRRKLHRFFGLNRNAQITVYLSSLLIEPRAAKGVRERPNGYNGCVIPDKEFYEIPRLSQLFQSSALDRIPDVLSGLVDNLWLFKKPTLDFLASPKDEKEIRLANLICLGGPSANLATDYYLRTGSPYLTITRDESGVKAIKIAKGSRTGETLMIYQDPKIWDAGIVLKVFDKDHGNVVFIVSGLTITSTRAASLYLVENWESLYKKYGDQEFGICVRCPSRHQASDGFKRAELMIQLPS